MNTRMMFARVVAVAAMVVMLSGCDNYREYELHEIKLDQEIAPRTVIDESDCQILHGVVVYARKQEHKTPSINSYNFYYINLEDGEIDGSTKILAKELYYFPHYVPKGYVAGQRIKLRYWQKSGLIVELSDVDAADIEMEATK